MTFLIHVFLFGKHGICSCPSVPPPGRLSPMSGSLPSFLKLSYHMYSIIPELLVLQGEGSNFTLLYEKIQFYHFFWGNKHLYKLILYKNFKMR